MYIYICIFIYIYIYVRIYCDRILEWRATSLRARDRRDPDIRLELNLSMISLKSRNEVGRQARESVPLLRDINVGYQIRDFSKIASRSGADGRQLSHGIGRGAVRRIDGKRRGGERGPNN